MERLVEAIRNAHCVGCLTGAGLPRLTLQAGGKVFIINAQPTSLDDSAAGVYRDLTAFATAIEETF